VNSYTVNHKRKGGSYGLVATAEDYWRFAQMILNSVRILSPQTVRLMGRITWNQREFRRLKRGEASG